MTRSTLSVTDHRRVLLAMLAMLFVASMAAAVPAMAQTDPAEGNPAEAPTPAADDGDGAGSPIVVELPNVTVDEDGTVRWTVETDPTTLDETDDPPVTADPVEEVDTGAADDAPEPLTDPDLVPGDEPEPLDTGGNDEPLETSDDNGGRLRPILLIAAGVVMAATAGGLLYLRRRRTDTNGVEAVVEDAMLPGDGSVGPLDPQFQYDGADAAGAYETGGAAYAQHVEGTKPVAVAEEPAPGRILSLHTSMIELADRGLSEAGRDKVVAHKLEAAGSLMRPGEWLLMATGGTLGALLLATFVLGWVLGALLAAVVGYGFWFALERKAQKRVNAFADDLPETLQLIAGSLRGGTSIMQAVQTVAEESDEPTAGEFQRIVAESRLGRDIGVSFREVAKRMDSEDFDWVVTAIDIHREVGGDLASILDRVGATIRARNRVRGQVASLSAEGKLSGLILFVLPPGMVGMIALTNRPYLDEMIGTGEGQILLAIAAALLVVGGLWLKRLARFVY